jgi:hypothetical protein
MRILTTCFCALLLLPACGDKDDTQNPETDDTQAEGVQYEVTGGGYGCDGSGMADFSADTSPEGADKVIVTLVRTADDSDYTETHHIPYKESVGGEDRWALELSIVVAEGGYEDGLATVFDCDEDEDDLFTLKYTVYDADGVGTGCRVTGDDESYFEADDCD